MDSNLLTLKEVAERIKLNEKAVTRLAQTGAIAAAKVGGHWRFQREAVNAWLASRDSTPAAGRHLPPEATGLPATTPIAEAITPNRINLNLAAAERDGVLRELVALVIPPQQRELSETLFKALKVREDLCSTCVNEGVAVPHSRNALVGLVDRVVLAYGRHRTGIDFGALDGKPVRHFFLVCAPNVRQHLQLLARLSRVLNQAEFRSKLDRVTETAEMIALLRAADEAL